ncbi:MAG: phage protein Gp36 family protein [Candidatus Heimdallarchaeaceae archaeon]
MAYSTYTSILNILPGLPQTSTQAGYSETVLVIQSHITRADSIIDSKCARRYAVPFSSTPPLIQTISEDITAYFSYRSFFTQDNQNLSDYFEELKQNALDLLDQIQQGKLDLVDNSGNLIEEKSSEDLDLVDSNTREYQPFFDIDTTTSWNFDSSRLDEVDDARD